MTEPRSFGRKSIRASLRPADLMADETLAHAWRAEVITLLPGAFPGVLGESLTGRALQEGKWQLRTHDLREYGEGRHRNVDDTPAGGGAGMVIRADILGAAIEAAEDPRRPLPRLLLSPRGRRFDQAMAARLAAGPGALFICGRFEGVDERAIEHYGLIEVSLGDFVLTGGDLAAQAMIDASLRLRPGILGNAESAVDESFSSGLLEHPQYTKPAEWQGRAIPEVLLSGHHGRIAQWRQSQAEEVTKARRPDLWAAWAKARGRTE
ncbi:tRNA (guanosine(37)-N1)-methyltransferase TrmD [Pseudoroseicyclus sp. CXY001]|uniref:tRNA (guanosine(37)-N1)-methyltransferase TrmD n=1 Tax=Pseudoroseicyclus sp. CXY001 TaxID=3242492 RepID=UPI003570BFA3